MGLETGTYISDLNESNPTVTDLRSEGDDHFRLIKSTVKATFPNITGAVTPTHDELNYVDGVTSAIQTQIDSKLSKSGGTMTGLLTLSGDPSTALQAATKQYVDNSDITPVATTSVSGKVTLSDNTNTKALTDTSKVPTPSSLAALLNITPAKGNAPIFSCRAWANFDSLQVTGTYSQSGTTVTVTMTAHGFLTGQWILVDITSGTAVDGWYQITGVTTNTFTYTAGTSLTTSGNISKKIVLKAGGNISSMAYLGIGSYTITFTTALDDAGYSLSGSSTDSNTASLTPLLVLFPSTLGVPTGKVAGSCNISLQQYNGTSKDSGDVSAMFFR